MISGNVFKRASCRSVITLFAFWCAFSFLLSLSVRLLVFFSGNIVALFDGALSEVFSAWREADVDTPVWLIILLGCALSALFKICFSRVKTCKSGILRICTRVLSVLFIVITFFFAFGLVLLITKINSVPVSVIAEIVGDLAGEL